MEMHSGNAALASNDPRNDELRFQFGKNWLSFSSQLDDVRIKKAEESLQEALKVSDLRGKTFLDIGSGSGLFSLAARRLGARVVSFDYDESSVTCTKQVRDRFSPNDREWTVMRGSVLDEQFLSTLGTFDVVYSWGVLHHTGEMWRALAGVVPLVAPGGKLFISLYNDQGWPSKAWWWVKRAYNTLPKSLRFLVVIPALIRLWGPTIIRDFVRLKPFSSWLRYSRERGMSPFHDVIDWIGGFPFEVSRPGEIFSFYRERCFTLELMRTCGGGHGCNEYVFSKTA